MSSMEATAAESVLPWYFSRASSSRVTASAARSVFM